MADPEPNRRDRPPLSLGSDDWPATLADKIVEVVDAVRVQTTDRVVFLLRAVVYCLVAAVAAIAIVVLVTIAAIRVADAYLPIGDGVGSATWAAHGFTGLLVSIIGLGAWRARTGSAKPLYAALILDAVIVVGVVFYGVIIAVV